MGKLWSGLKLRQEDFTSLLEAKMKLKLQRLVPGNTLQFHIKAAKQVGLFGLLYASYSSWYYLPFTVQFVSFIKAIVLVRPNCRWDPFAFFFVQGVVNNGPVVEGSLAGIFVSVHQGVFAPVLLHRQWLLSFEWFWVVVFIHTVLVVLPVFPKYWLFRRWLIIVLHT